MPKIVDHDARRAEISEGVWRIVMNQGIEKVTIRTLEEETGWSRGVLTHYFRDKDDILISAFRLLSRRIEEGIAVDLDSSFDTARLYDALLANLPLTPDSYRTAQVWHSFLSRAPSRPALQAEYRQRYAIWREGLARALEILTRRGELPEGVNLEALAEVIIAFVDGLGIAIVLEPERFPRARVEGIVRGFVASLPHAPRTQAS